jgi:hypothetical protein
MTWLFSPGNAELQLGRFLQASDAGLKPGAARTIRNQPDAQAGKDCFSGLSTPMPGRLR